MTVQDILGQYGIYGVERSEQVLCKIDKKVIIIYR